jgi:photosystem II Psb27 protein
LIAFGFGRGVDGPNRLTDSNALCELIPQQAMAFGFGGGESREEKYTKETQAIIAQVKSTLELAPGAEGREESINTTRQMTNAWVAKYRRDNATTGKPSYGQVYSALNAVSGHFNNFGTKYPFPAKRKDRVYQEFESAELLLSRGR